MLRRWRRRETRLEIRHEQRSRDSFSSDIAYANADAIFVELNHVEVVATDFTRRLPRAGDLNSGGLRQRAGQQHLLNLARPLEFLFLLLQRDGPFLDGLLQQLVAFFQLSLDFFQTEPEAGGDQHDDDAEITDFAPETENGSRSILVICRKSIEPTAQITPNTIWTGKNGPSSTGTGASHTGAGWPRRGE